jgi:hypothetical protein
MDDQDLARIRLVTRRYHELQGLGRVALGAGLVAAWLVADLVLGTRADAWAFLLPPAAAAAIAVPGKLASDRLYALRFGRVRQGGDEKAAGYALLLGLGLFMALTIEEHVAGRGYPSLLFLVLAASRAHTFVRDWPLRRYVAVEVIALALASGLYVTVDPSVSREAVADVRYAFLWKGLGLNGVAVIVVGMLDHRLLMNTLGGRQVSGTECEHADTV